MKRLAAVLLCLVLNIRCSELEFENENGKGSREITVDSMNLSDLIKARVEPTSRPQKYAVYLSWPKIEEDKKVRIRLSEVLALVGPGQTSFSHEVDHNQNLTYVLDILGSANRIEKSYKKLVKVPMDLVMGDSFKGLTEDTKITAKRAFFISQSKFLTNGHRFELQSEELISNNAEIVTFEEGKNAEPGVDGRIPKEIVIKTQSAAGKLIVIMRGEAGGYGVDGLPIKFAAQSGSSPGTGEEKCICDRNCQLNGTGGTCKCTSRGFAGGRGSDGLRGNPGGNAGAGGSTGRLTVSIQDGREFDLQVLKEPGSPGIPGKGGSGQPGGSGGKKTSQIICPGPDGENGKDGLQGQEGMQATKGQEDPVCIYIASEEKNDCF